MGILKPLLSLSTSGHADLSDQTVLQQALTDSSSKSATLINCFMLCWFFIGSYWIYTIYEPKYGKDCDRNLYLFAFCLVTAVYLTVAVVLVIIFFIFFVKMFAFCIAKLRSKTTEQPANV